METYSVRTWSVRRALGELKIQLEQLGAAIPLGEAFQYGPLVVVKVAATAIVHALPDKPTFAQLEGLPKDKARILDTVDFAIRTDNLGTAFSRATYAWFWKFTIQDGDVGVVYVWPAFYGFDP